MGGRLHKNKSAGILQLIQNQYLCSRHLNQTSEENDKLRQKGNHHDEEFTDSGFPCMLYIV